MLGADPHTRSLIDEYITLIALIIKIQLEYQYTVAADSDVFLEVRFVTTRGVNDDQMTILGDVFSIILVGRCGRWRGESVVGVIVEN